MTTTAIQGHAISRDDVRMLKAAASVVYRSKDGESYIQVNNKDNDVEPHIIPCTTLVSNHDGSLGEVIGCDYGEAHLSYSHEYMTRVNCMQAGDVLTLNWIACNDNNYMKQAGLHADELHLRIERMKDGKRKRYDFHVTTQVCPNNSVKMIRHTNTPKRGWEQ
jgi:hypothetical protein